MQRGEETNVDAAITDIATLLAEAYRRRTRIRLVHTTSGSLPSAGGLDKNPEKSVHELKLTGQRKGSTQR